MTVGPRPTDSRLEHFQSGECINRGTIDDFSQVDIFVRTVRHGEQARAVRISWDALRGVKASLSSPGHISKRGDLPVTARTLRASASPSGSSSRHAEDGPSCRISHSNRIPLRLQLSSVAISFDFSSARSSSRLIRRSIVNQHSSGTTLKFVPPPLFPPSISIEWPACSAPVLKLLVLCSTIRFTF